MIDVAITEKLFDDSFVRQWTNGTFLIRLDTGAALTEADLTASGSANRFVAWDEIADAPILYDSLTGGFERQPGRLSIAGARTVMGKDGGALACEPAFARLAALAAQFTAGEFIIDHLGAPDKVRQAVRVLAANRPVSMFMHNGVGQHTNATQTSRAIATFYALFGDFDRQGGNVVFPKAPLNAMSGKEFLPKEMAQQRIGRERKPLGPPAKPGNCAAYDIFTAVLEGRPYPVKALLNFGSNTIMSTGDSQRAREAFCAVDFAVAAELFMTPTAELCDYVLPATSFLEMATVSNDFKHREQGRRHVQYRPAVVAPLAERRSDTWMVFELAKRLGFADDFWQGDIDAAYEHELAAAGITLTQLKASPGGITVRGHAALSEICHAGTNPARRAVSIRRIKKSRFTRIPSRRMDLRALPEYVEPMVSPRQPS